MFPKRETTNQNKVAVKKWEYNITPLTYHKSIFRKYGGIVGV